MATFPSWVKYELGSEDAASAVERTEMERGVPKQRRANSDVLVQQDITIFFRTTAEASTWDTFFYTTIKAGQDWFDFTPIRTGVMVQARVVGGNPGKLTKGTKTWVYSQRTLRIEWLRNAT